MKDKLPKIARVLLMHAVGNVLSANGNSYANSYTECWLKASKALGVYEGEVIGKIKHLAEKWDQWCDENGGLPELPECEEDSTTHKPQYRYDCPHCQFNWCCGYECSCALKHSQYKDPPLHIIKLVAHYESRIEETEHERS